MYIQAIEFRNWLPFKGSHYVELEQKCYAVVAEVDSWEGRSNWSGKSSFLEGIPFAFFGMHRKRTEDEWIHDGQRDGYVKVFLSNEVIITRSRTRGEATRLVVEDGGTTLSGPAAQEFINDMLGMTKEDFYATCFFRQKDIAHMVYARPGERAKEFASWFKLETLRSAESDTLGRLRQVRDQLDEAKQSLTGLVLGMSQVLNDDEEVYRNNVSSEYIAKGYQRLQHLLTNADSVLVKAKADYDAVLDRIGNKQREAEAHKNNLQGYNRYMHAKDELDGLERVEPIDPTEFEALSQEMADCQSKVDAATRAYNNARLLADGKFDGRCPVNGMDCPAKKRINSDAEKNRKIKNEAKDAYNTAMHNQSQTKRRWTEANEQNLRAKNVEKRIAALEARMNENRFAYKSIRKHPDGPDITEVNNQREDAYLTLQEVQTAQAEALELVSTWEAGEAEAEQLENDIEILSREVDKLSAAAFILGPQGAQRAIAERVLSGITHRGNEMLKDAGIDLTFEITWAREGEGLSSVCTGCGTPFPKSRKVKSCPKCQTERGPNLIEKSDILFSERSGAAEDIVGGVIRIAAGAWFRNDRGSAWETLFIDEPFGALDETNRESFSRLLLSACKPAMGNTQSFIVAHHNDVLSTLPGLVRVLRKDGKSSLEVVGGESD